MQLLDKKDLIKIKVIPKLSKGETKKLRPDRKRPMQGVVLPRGSHKIVLKVSESRKDRRRNRISDIGLILPGIKGDVKANDKFVFVKVTVVKVVRVTGREPKVVRKVIKVPKSALVKDLKDVLDTVERSVKKIIINLKVKTNVKVRLNVKGCVDRRVTTVTTTRLSIFPSRLTKICSSSLNLLSDTQYLSITSSSTLQFKNFNFLRLNSHKDDTSIVLPDGDYNFEIIAPVNEAFTLNQFGLYIFGETSIRNVENIIGMLKVVVTRILTNYCQIVYMSPTMKISKRLSIDNIKNLLKKKITNVHQVIISFKLRKPIKLKIKMFGCKEIRDKIKQNYSDHQCKKNLFIVKELFDVYNIPKIDSIFNKNLIKTSREQWSGVIFNKGLHQILISIKRRRVILREIGLIILEKNKDDKIGTHFKDIIITISKKMNNLNKIRKEIRISSKYKLKKLYNVLIRPIKETDNILIKINVRNRIRIRLNIKGCFKQRKKINIVKEKIKKGESNIKLNEHIVNTQYSEINEQGLKCKKIYNLIKHAKNAIIKSVPKLKPAAIKSLRFDSKKPQIGTVLTPGNYKIEIIVPSGKSVTLVKLGLVFVQENQYVNANKVIKNLKVIATRSRTSFGKILYINQVIALQKQMKIKDLKNLLKVQIASLSKISYQFKLLKKSKTSIIFKGCGAKPAKHTKVPTKLPSVTTPYSAVNEQGLKCKKVYNLIKYAKNAIIKSVPTLKPAAIKSLRFDSKKPQIGTVLTPGNYKIDIIVPFGKSITLANLGLVFAQENQNMNSNKVIRNLNVIVTRSRTSFGKIVYINQVIDFPKLMKIKDLKNLLKVHVASMNKVTLQFSLLKIAKTSIIFGGCEITNPVTTLSLISGTQGYGIINNKTYMCSSSVNLLHNTKLLSISVIPNVTDYDLFKLRFKERRFFPGAYFLSSPYEIKIQLPFNQIITVSKLGLEFPIEKFNHISKSLISSITLEVTRIINSYGSIKFETQSLTLTNIIFIKGFINLSNQQLTHVHKIVIRFNLLKNVAIRLLLNGCYSPYVQERITTAKPLGCVHLGKYYQPNDLITVNNQCDYKICIDGEVISIFQCLKGWTSWKPCNKLCGAGHSTRRQICAFNQKLKNINKMSLMTKIDEKCYEKIEITPCFEKPCEVSCKYSTWSSWSGCNNNNCNDEYQVRTREELINPKHRKCTEPLMESRRCIKPNCSCIENAEMNNCANILCPTNCDHLNDKVKCVKSGKECIRACICKLGFLYQYGKCVLRQNCECLKPILKGWLKTTTFKSSIKSSSTKFTKLRHTRRNKDLGKKPPNKYSSTDKSQKSKAKQKFRFKFMNKKEYLTLKDKIVPTESWLPGQTPQPIVVATYPLTLGTTPAGATIKRADDSQNTKRTPTPPSGFTAAPPRNLFNPKVTLNYFVTTRYIFNNINQQNPTKTIKGVQKYPNNNNNANVPTSSESTLGSNVPPSNYNPSEVIPAEPKNGINPGSNDKNNILPMSSITTTSPYLKNRYTKANSTILVNCRSCLCSNGKLVCSGPKCNAGNNIWSEWTEWSPCTAMCGNGFKRRFRQCYGYGCKDNSIPAPGIKRFSPALEIEAEDKACSMSECSCVYTRGMFRIRLGDDQIKKYNIDLGIAWIEKDNIKGLSSPEERIKQDDVLKSGETVFMKCSHCICKDGQISCTIDCK